MAVIAIRDFKGEIPRTPKHLLPDGAAQLAINCDFSAGQLKPILGKSNPQRIPTNSGTATFSAGSLFTDTGDRWWASSTDDVRFYKSPVIGDTNDRGYFLGNPGGRVYVDILPTTGDFIRAPSTSTYVGVPAPTTAPTLEVYALGVIPGLTSASWYFSYWYESGGVRYQEAAVVSPALGQVTANEQWTFTPAAVDNGTEEAPKTPSGAVLVVQAILRDGDKEIFKLNTSTSASVGARTAALPGGVEMSISKNTTTNLVTVKLTWGPVDTRAYVFTVKNLWAEESAPSPAALVSPTYIQGVRITTQAVDFTGYRARAAGTDGVGIYRTFGGSSEYLSVAVSSTATPNQWLDTVHTPANVGTTLKTFGWTPPPSALNVAVGMHLTPNGWFIAAKGNTLYMSEPYRPHAWPYSLTLPRNIRGICVGPQSIVVTTVEATYVINGPHPASVTQQKLTTPVGGISSRGMVATETGVAVITNDGIMFVNGTSASLAEGQRLFTRQTWRDFYSSVLSQMRLAYHDGKLLGCLSQQDGVSQYGFLLRTDEGPSAGNFSRVDTPINAVAISPVGDTLHFTTGSETTEGLVTAHYLYTYAGGSYLSATWWSKEYVFADPVEMGGLYIRTDTTCTIEVYKDGSLVKNQDGTNFSISAIATSPTASTMAGKGYFRLPATGPGLRWSIKITNIAGVIYEVLLGNTFTELRNA